MRRRARQIFKSLGPGLITGAADDDPSGIATYSQGGAQFGAGLLWTLGFTTPLMIAIQLVSARIGWLTGKGLAASFRQLMPAWASLTIVGLLVVANTLNIAADVAAMGEALQLLVGGPEHGHALLFGLLCTVLPLWLGFDALVRLLKWLTLALLSYVAVVLMLHVDWNMVLRESIVPHLSGGRDYWTMVVAVLGTTISPYLFFWQASQEAEQRQRMDRASGEERQTAAAPSFVREHLHRIKLDTTIGMLFSNIIAFCVMLAAALTLHAHGVTDVHTTAEAAQALRALGGRFHLHAVRLRHRGHGNARGAGARGVVGLRGRRSLRVAVGPGPSADGGARLLRGHRVRHRHRHAARLHAARPDARPRVERDRQRHDRRADHDRADVARLEPGRAGPVHADAAAPRARVVRDGRHGRRAPRHAVRLMRAFARQLLALARPHSRRFATIAALAILATGFDLVEPLIYRFAVNDIAGLFVEGGAVAESRRAAAANAGRGTNEARIQRARPCRTVPASSRRARWTRRSRRCCGAWRCCC